MTHRMMAISLGCLLSWACSDAEPGPTQTPDAALSVDIFPAEPIPQTDVVAPPDSQSSGDTEALDSGTPGAVVTGLEIEPSILLVEPNEGTQQPLELSVNLVYDDGTKLRVTEDIVWTSSDSTIVSVDTGSPIATGQAEGPVIIVAMHQGLFAECSVTVRFVAGPTRLVEEMTEAEVAAFETASSVETELAPQWAYPTEGTVFPCGMYPPLLQWHANGSLYFRVTLSNQAGVSVLIYTIRDQYQPTRATWQSLCDFGGAELTMRVAGTWDLSESVRHESLPRHIVGAEARLEGTIYYWGIESKSPGTMGTDGSIRMIDSSAPVPTATDVFPDKQPGECRGCHTLSLDGSKLAYGYHGQDLQMGGDILGKSKLGISWTDAPTPPLLDPASSYGANMSTFDPTADYMVVADNEKLWLGQLSPSSDPVLEMRANVAHVDDYNGNYTPMTPAWSPDGSTLIYALASNSPDVPAGTSLVSRAWDFETQSFESEQLVLNVDEIDGRSYHDYPSWTPHSQWLVARSSDTNLGHGPSVSGNDANDIGFIIKDLVSGQYQRLVRGAPAGPRYGRPSFSPFEEGGYYWLVFYSNGPYGHVKDNDTKQLWVMAIDKDSTLDEDPSHPAFWLPGQSLTSVNLSAYWARPICLADAEVCDDDEDCCVGLACELDPNSGVSTCEPTGCEVPGEYCDIKWPNCCEGYECKQSLSGAFSCQPCDEGSQAPSCP